MKGKYLISLVFLIKSTRAEELSGALSSHRFNFTDPTVQTNREKLFRSRDTIHIFYTVNILPVILVACLLK